MSNIHEHLDQIDEELAKEAENVVEEVNNFDPGVMWTPLIISAMVMMAIFAICEYISTIESISTNKNISLRLGSLAHSDMTIGRFEEVDIYLSSIQSTRSVEKFKVNLFSLRISAYFEYRAPNGALQYDSR